MLGLIFISDFRKKKKPTSISPSRKKVGKSKASTPGLMPKEVKDNIIKSKSTKSQAGYGNMVARLL